jgi:hypothetical protein
MSKNDEYRANAAECERMAKVAHNEADKQSWLGMARHWFAMIKEVVPAGKRRRRAAMAGHSGVSPKEKPRRRARGQGEDR